MAWWRLRSRRLPHRDVTAVGMSESSSRPTFETAAAWLNGVTARRAPPATNLETKGKRQTDDEKTRYARTNETQDAWSRAGAGRALFEFFLRFLLCRCLGIVDASLPRPNARERENERSRARTERSPDARVMGVSFIPIVRRTRSRARATCSRGSSRGARPVS
jgi:hypothetical protein